MYLLIYIEKLKTVSYFVSFIKLYTLTFFNIIWLFKQKRTQGVVHGLLCARLLLRLRGAYASLTFVGLRSLRLQPKTRTNQGLDDSITAINSCNQSGYMPHHQD